MTNQDMTLIKFETDFADFEQNRMYPPRYRKEAPMIKLTMQHINAICHAELVLDTLTGPVFTARMRAKTEDNLLRLAELKLYIIRGLYEPTLPLQTPKDPKAVNHGSES